MIMVTKMVPWYKLLTMHCYRLIIWLSSSLEHIV